MRSFSGTTRPLVVLVLAVMVLGVSGCDAVTSDPEPSPLQVMEEKAPYTSVWEDRTELGLFSRPIELVRATVEGWDTTSLFGADSFPGYKQAGGRTFRDPDAQDKTHFRVVTRAWASPTDIRAELCTATLFSKPSQTPVPGTTFLSVGQRTVILTRAEGAPEKPTAKVDNGRDRAGVHDQQFPTWNVFGSWKIVKNSLADVEECGREAVRRFPQARIVWKSNTFEVDNGPSLPVQPQFPRWIPADRT